MRKVILFLILSQVSLMLYGQIIADHTIVDRYDDIPQYYIDLVKKMWVVVAGESHSWGYMSGLNHLETLNSTYQVNNVNSVTPEAYTTSHLRSSRATWGDYSHSSGWIYDYGEEDWFTNATAIARTKASITYCNTNSLTISAFGFGWCYDTYAGGVTTSIDPVYNVHWYGQSASGPEGSKPWGIDAGDYPITANSVSMDTYLAATQAYIDYCATNGYTTKVFFTTGPVDTGNGLHPPESFYQAYLKYKHIRDYVAADPTRILFDYADILCYNDDGTLTTATWSGHTFPAITATNGTPLETAHISFAGALRLGKAMWWMLARIAGWNGVTNTIPVTGITVTGASGATTIATDNGTLQVSAAVLPANATNKTVTWSVTNGTGQVEINSTGLVTAVANGTVTAKATANDGSGVSGTLVLTISNQVIPVTGITVTGAGGSTIITTDNGTLQLSAAVLPVNATNKTVTWSVTNGTGQTAINSTGLVTAVANGTVTAKATANDGSGVSGTLVLTISNQVILVTGITVTGAGGSTIISTDNGTLQLIEEALPGNALNKSVTWSITNGTGQATISTAGLVTAIASGAVTAKATANDGSGVTGAMKITIFKRNIADQLVVIVNQNEMIFPLDESFLDCKISLYNLNGNLITSRLVKSDISVFDVTGFCSGLYIAVLSNNLIHKVAKVILP